MSAHANALLFQDRRPVEHGPSAVRWPFGEYRGIALGEIPSSYLEFLLQSHDGRHPHLMQDVKDELGRRKRARQRTAASEILPTWKAQMQQRYRRNSAALSIIREGADLFCALVKEAVNANAAE